MKFLRTRRVLFALGLAWPLAALAQVDLTTLDRDMVGRKSQVLVLGTVHLRGMPESFKPRALDGLLDKLAAYQPDIITVEDLPSEECDMVARFADKYGADFCRSTELAKASTGLDIPAASAQLQKALKELPSQPSAAQRRRLVMLFLAANNRVSAYTQWLQLPEAERHEGDGLDANLIKLIAEMTARHNESFLIAARLAARLGLQRVHQIDNHTGDNLDVADEKAFGEQIMAAWKADRAEMNAVEKVQAQLAKADDLLPLYRYINTMEHQRVDAQTNVRSQLRAPSKEGYPQMWVAGWEIRNLRMVANIRETFRERPGARVLSIVGAAHKPWFDSWLGQLQGIEIVDVEKVLK